MNVGSPDTQVPATACAGRAARDPNAVTAAETTDAATLFLGLLNQAATVPPLPVAAVTAIVVGALARATDAVAADEPVVDWVTPFLLPPQATPPRPLDLELTPLAADQGVTLADPSPVGNATVKPLPVLFDSATAGADVVIGEDDTAASTLDAVGSVVSSVGPRVEVTGATGATGATGNGAVQTLVRHVTVPVSDSRWSEHVGYEVRLLVERGVQGATLRLSPEHLGPVEVRIDIVNDKANVVFNAAHADTRAALADAIPKLREMFAGAGLTLGQADVRDNAPGQLPSPIPRHPAYDVLRGNADDEPASTGSTLRMGLVDAYA